MISRLVASLTFTRSRRWASLRRRRNWWTWRDINGPAVGGTASRQELLDCGEFGFAVHRGRNLHRKRRVLGKAVEA
jgi:hypothetical protein